MNTIPLPKPTLSVVPTTPSTNEKLFAIAKELVPTASDDTLKKMLERTDVIERLTAILAKRDATEAALKAAEEQKVIDSMANVLVKKANVELNPVKPKEPVVLLTIEKIAEITPVHPPTQTERIEMLKQKYGTKVPEMVFNLHSHAFAMGLRGAMIGVKMRFGDDLKKIADNEEMRVAYKNKCDSIQRFIDILTEIVKDGYHADPTNPKNHAKTQVYNQVLSLLQTDPRLFEHCKLPETRAEREARERLEAEAAQEASKAEQQKIADREKMVNDIVRRMMTDNHFEKLGVETAKHIAKRIARQFSGSSPESRMKQAAQEKRGGDVNEANKQLGKALARAAGCTPDEVSAMFPAPKQKQGKKKQKR